MSMSLRKQIPHEDVAPTLFSLVTKVKGAVGRAIMPTVFTPEGEVALQRGKGNLGGENRYCQ